MQPRRSRRNGGDDTSKESTQKKEEEEQVDVDEEGTEDLEVTRCICGQTEYPGPNDTVRQMVSGQRTLPTPTQTPGGFILTIAALESLGDELGSFFVCCDKCSVWQHGGCVGLTNEATLPEEYYCEQCKPELHKLIKGSNGHVNSLPLRFLSANSLTDSNLHSIALSSKLNNPRARPPHPLSKEGTPRVVRLPNLQRDGRL